MAPVAQAPGLVPLKPSRPPWPLMHPVPSPLYSVGDLGCLGCPHVGPEGWGALLLLPILLVPWLRLFLPWTVYCGKVLRAWVDGAPLHSYLSTPPALLGMSPSVMNTWKRWEWPRVAPRAQQAGWCGHCIPLTASLPLLCLGCY